MVETKSPANPLFLRVWQAELAFETAVTQEMRVDDMVDHVESEMRDEEVFELFPHPYGIQFFGFHDG